MKSPIIHCNYGGRAFNTLLSITDRPNESIRIIYPMDTEGDRNSVRKTGKWTQFALKDML